MKKIWCFTEAQLNEKKRLAICCAYYRKSFWEIFRHVLRCSFQQECNLLSKKKKTGVQLCPLSSGLVLSQAKSLGKGTERGLESGLHASKQEVSAIESMLRGLDISDKPLRSTSLDHGTECFSSRVDTPSARDPPFPLAVPSSSHLMDSVLADSTASNISRDQLASVIGKEVEHELRLVVDVRKEVKKLETKLTLIKAVLEDAEKKEIHENAVKIWLEDLKDVMYDADDVLDEWNTRIFISRIEGFTADGSHVANKMCSSLLSPCACFKHGGARYDIAHRIKDIRERLAEVALTNKDQLHLLPSHSHAEPPQFTSSVVDVSEVFGRDLDKQEILSMLLCETSKQETQVRIPILSIVGTGGFGKTTLAQLVDNEGTIATTFELKIWVCVSEPFDRERIAKEIIAHATGEKLPENVVGWDLLHEHLCNSVRGKRFLLVLDDIWTRDSGLWEPLKLSLNGGERGSKIIVTTRNEAVATMIGSIYIHRLA
ncbi:hypothetical protein IFM89_024629 [Coptis chinensis]|uniref:Uncharacterized protein n=1 Tax=Coptis chinensis TaxID=261450 RepID=A0A835I6B5_9MAGN|nr:hypothetical protein IFM89_024629 [Coptis chinensis]